MAILDKIDIDFQLYSAGDPKLLVIIDTSVWGAIEEGISIIEITPPSSAKKKTYIFDKGKTNVFNSSNLLLSEVGEKKNLPDGIYHIAIKGSPDTFSKHRDIIKTDKLELEVDKLYIALGLDNSDEVKKKKRELQEIDLMIRASKASVRRGELKKGLCYYKRALEDTKRYNSCKTCNS